MKTVLNYCIKILAPVHIGCDEIYDPLSFTLTEEENCITAFNQLEVISGFAPGERDEFFSLCQKGDIPSILEIYRFFRGRQFPGRKIAVCRGFIDHYTKTLNLSLNNRHKLQKELNRFEIERTAFRQSDSRPFIPGTAVKGALRTAYLNEMNARKRIPAQRGRSAHAALEKKLLDTARDKKPFETDPFRMIKVSDFMPVGSIPSKIIYAVNKKKKVSDFSARGPYQILETLSPDAFFQGSITIETPRAGSNIKSPITEASLTTAVRSFYSGEYDRECRELQRIGISCSLQPQQGSEFLRLGRHCGAQSVTIEGHRNIKIMKGFKERPAYETAATTLWLASDVPNADHTGLLPFGWVQFAPLSAEEKDMLNKKEEQWGLARREERRERAAALTSNQVEEQRRKERILKERLREEEQLKQQEKKRAMLEAMSQEDRAVAQLDDPDIAENRVIEIYNEMINYPHEKQVEIARKLKAYWVANNKWVKKACSKKQQAKVNRIKQLLIG